MNNPSKKVKYLSVRFLSIKKLKMVKNLLNLNISLFVELTKVSHKMYKTA